ncbi:MAG: quinoprotein dehydrogenase-associated putative ABC transporter substrate-binding protein [Acidobacteria bacterium]|nr:quinoprotein dehydrogenase-associated putative ABC transporter substrate-binding protein [Acidobacteriota bacterium]MBV8893998.1 quinoprotein dehydrogenase-associated putative ABC transporter substrate-binding protein [Acidobacteriota bacterium]MBV9481065.1 quinoprotein dehydrogenase-associated putative ABC transporter substrate-binding protein [Acidobacteriota bacterium]
MYFRFRKGLWAATIAIALSGLCSARELRVCADPDNLPFSNRQERGFENRLAQLVSGELNLHLTYEWQRMGRGFVREYLDGSRCDLLIGIPSKFKPVLTTAPYYRSSYVFVTRRDYSPQPQSLNDPALRRMKIGVQVLEEDYTPPATALARRHLEAQIVGFETTGADADSIIRAVAEGRVDTAIVWGPLAGFFARRYRNELELTALTPALDPPALPFTFSISMGVRRGETAMRDRLDQVLARRRRDIDRILDEYGVPQLPLPENGRLGG